MEVALKERLVGAVVLVALGVWLIPLFLDGSDGEGPTGSQPLALPVPASPKPDRTTKTIHLGDVTSSSPGPTAPANATSPRPAAPEPTVARPQPELATSKTAPKRSPAPVSGWFVQLGSFGSEANAKRLAAQVSALGWDAQLSQLTAGGKTMHRVRVGPVPTRSKADALRGELAQRGFEGKVMSEP